MRNRLIPLGCAAVLLVALAKADEEPNPYQSLIDNSPFITPAFKARLGQRDAIAVGFIGYTRIGDQWHIALFDKKSGKALWLRLDEEQEGIKVERFDQAEQQIHLTVGGIGFDLKLEKE
jgi:hypothetical protein